MAEEKKTKAARLRRATTPRRRGQGEDCREDREGQGREGRRQGQKAARLPEGPTRRGMKTHYDEVIRAKLIEEFGYKNPLEVPTIEKIVLNMGVGEAVNDTKKVTTAAARSRRSSPARSRSSRAPARRSRPSRCARTCRSAPRSRCARRACTSSSTAWSRSRCRAFATSAASTRSRFDGRGNYALGIKEHIVFPEIDYDKAESVLGMDIIVVHDGEDRRRGARAAARVQFPVPAVS